MKPSLNFLITFFILTTLTLTGCGNDSSSTSEASKDVSTPRERLVKTINKYNVSCENPSECPEYIAMLAIEKKDELGFVPGYRCSSFLIGEDVIATNGDCIPTDLNAGDSCKGRIFALFPKSRGKKSQTVNCEKIISKFRDNDLGYDYAFIKLEKKPGRLFPEIDFSEKASSLEVTLWKVNPMEDFYGQIKKATCKLIDDSIFSLENFNSPLYSPSFSYSGCESIPGNSGSPVLNGKGKIVGINWGGNSNWNQIAEIYKDLIPDGIMEGTDVATNFSCLCKNGDGYTHLCEDTPKSCQKITDDLAYDKTFSNFFKEQAKKFLGAEDLSFLQNLPKNFLFTPIEFNLGFARRVVYEDEKPLSYHLIAGLIPKCIKDSQKLWENSSKYNSEGKEYKYLYYYDTPLCEINLTLNSKMQVIAMTLDRSKCFINSFYMDFPDTSKSYETLKNGNLKVDWWAAKNEGAILPSSISLNLSKCENAQLPLAAN